MFTENGKREWLSTNVLSLQSVVSLLAQYPIPLMIVAVLVIVAIASYVIPLIPFAIAIFAIAIIVFSSLLIIFLNNRLHKGSRNNIIRWALAILISVIFTFSISPWFGNNIMNITVRLSIGAVILSGMATYYMGSEIKAAIKKWEDGHSIKSL